jgi:DNA-binding XRE family transcriptional regulator
MDTQYKYYEVVADEIVKKHHLSIDTKTRWEKAGFIPAKYFETPRFTILGFSLIELRLKLQEKYPDKEINQEFLSNVFKVKRQHWNMWERGKITPRNYYLNAIEEYFKKELELTNEATV